MYKISFKSIIIYFFFLSNIAVAQVTTPFSSLIPIGEIYDNSFANNLGMGGVGISNGSYSCFSILGIGFITIIFITIYIELIYELVCNTSIFKLRS